MKIKSFHVTNFKSLVNTNVANLGSKNMFFGLNNSGKSNLLKFLSLVFQDKTFGQTVKTAESDYRQTLEQSNFWQGEIINSPYLFHANNTEKPIEFQVTLGIDHSELPLFNDLKNEGIIKLSRNESNVFIDGQFEYVNTSTSRISLKQVQIDNKIVYETNDYFPKNKNLNQSHFETILQFFNNCILFLDSNRVFNYKSNGANRNNQIEDTFTNEFFDLYLKQYDSFVTITDSFSAFKVDNRGIDILKHHILNSPLSKPEIGFTKFGETYEIMLKTLNGGRYPLSSFGTGIQQLFFMLSKIFKSNSKIVFIEELELNLSPLYQIELLKFMDSEISKTKNKKIHQLFFTSHSKYFCNKTDLVFVYEVTIDEFGHSSVVKANKSRINAYFSKNYY